jgi:hypothetical protein
MDISIVSIIQQNKVLNEAKVMFMHTKAEPAKKPLHN